MKNELEAIVIGLEEAGLKKQKETLITALQMLEQELSDMGQTMKVAMHDCIDVDDYGRLEKLQQLNVLIQTASSNLHDIPTATRYENKEQPIVEKMTNVDSITGRSPSAIIINGERIDLPKDRWVTLLEHILRYCARVSPKRFEEMTQQMPNQSSLSFLGTTSEAARPYAQVVHIPELNQYVEISGSAERIWLACESVLKFYNLQGQYEILLNNKVRNKRK